MDTNQALVCRHLNWHGENIQRYCRYFYFSQNRLFSFAQNGTFDWSSGRAQMRWTCSIRSDKWFAWFAIDSIGAESSRIPQQRRIEDQCHVLHHKSHNSAFESMSIAHWSRCSPMVYRSTQKKSVFAFIGSCIESYDGNGFRCESINNGRQEKHNFAIFLDDELCLRLRRPHTERYLRCMPPNGTQAIECRHLER